MRFPLIRTVSWFHKNLVICSTGHMTPEIRLRLLTPQCPLWTSQPDDCPFIDPYWAFYWPGGQALTRYTLDNPQIVRGKRVLDLGCGCGASVIAARLSGAGMVTANDTDQVALLATMLNAKLNGLKLSDMNLEDSDLINRKSSPDWDVIMVGDMFYDSEFSRRLLDWLKGKMEAGAKVIIGDPGRHGLTNSSFKMTPLERYSLPDHMTREHYGFTVATVYRLE